MTYAGPGTTAGTLMHGYKSPQATREQQVVVTLLAHLGLRHARCAERIVEAPITHYATVPSTRGRSNHLLALISRFARWPQHPLEHRPGVTPQRQMVQDTLFASPPLPDDAHVLLIEDTWTSGNKALSATAALRAAGTSNITLLCLARWLSFDFIQHRTNPVGLDAILSRQHVYNVRICPFTGRECSTIH